MHLFFVCFITVRYLTLFINISSFPCINSNTSMVLSKENPKNYFFLQLQSRTGLSLTYQIKLEAHLQSMIPHQLKFNKKSSTLMKGGNVPLALLIQKKHFSMALSLNSLMIRTMVGSGVHDIQ